MHKFSYLKSQNAGYIDQMFAQYLANPDSVDDSWRFFFEGIELGAQVAPEAKPNGHAEDGAFDLSSEAKVADLIAAYREYGRLVADIDPLNTPPATHPLLELARFGLADADLDRSFTAGRLIGIGPAKLREILTALRETYCRSIAVEFTHIDDPSSRLWLQQKMEATRNRPTLDPATRKLILKRLTESESLERFLHTRYVAQKRFSLEGGESTIPALDCMIEVGADLGAKEFVLGMAHRGRLNVLVNIFGKKPEHVFVEFEGTYKLDTAMAEGDVKYHKGYSADPLTRGGHQVHLSLASNPSHLEFVNPVVEGVARAKQTRLDDRERTKVIPILIHGDAAFAGQGVCYETLNLSQLEGYCTGGTLHLVINNQVGFTTSPQDARSTTYSTDLAKMLESPIFHVNGDDPEAVWYVSRLATEYRQKFKSDVVIDLICYRKHGHNEGDEPSFTQPLMYKKIKTHPSTRELYEKALSAAGLVPEPDAKALVDEAMAKFSSAQELAREKKPNPHQSVFEGAWKGLRQPTEKDLFKPAKTAVDEKALRSIAERINRMPPGFHLHPKLGRFFEARAKAVADGIGIDWGNAETLAYATLVAEGHAVRLSGQDAERGTFTHRHSVLSDSETGERHTPLHHVKDGQALFAVHNSHLSEVAVLGFEFGYSLAYPESLVIWEAQFGDFANGAQVIIDAFLASAESKWQRMSGLVLLLPHGYEGQGPEHSSARLERFLQLCGRNNLFVCNLTTPAQIFHALRRQVIWDFRKPLIVMSPKSLLRHSQAVSKMADFTQAGFQEVIDDARLEEASVAKKAKRVLLCSGKLYYELVAEREAKSRTDVAVVRLEQLHPWPAARLEALLARYPAAKDLVWVQEEPRNMGAWSFVFNTWSGGLDDFRERAGSRAIRYVGREIGAASAVGSHKVHEEEQRAIVQKAFA